MLVVFLCCLFMFLCLGCVTFSGFQLCRVFLYKFITSITNITKHTTKKNVCVCWCVSLFVLIVLFVLFVHVSVFDWVCFSCFQLCRVFLYRLITNTTNITKPKTRKHVCVCCCLLCCVCSCVRCVSWFAFLVSNYAACSFIG